MIKLLGAVEGDCKISVDDVLQTLECPQQLQHNSNFTGRPATQLYVASCYVAKLRTDFVFQPKDAVKRCAAALMSDRQLGAYHPDKSWFVIEQNDTPLIGNIAPRLQAFHSALPSLFIEDASRAITKLSGLLELYFSVANETQLRLDEGLSNFGWDAQQNIYYLDDDRYRWDDFTSLASILAVWIRQIEHFNVAHAMELGESISRLLVETFESRHKLQVFLGQLRHCMTVGNREQECITAISNVLQKTAYKKTSASSASVLADSPGSQEIDARSGNTPQKSTGKFAVLADVHANLPALLAVLEDIDKQGVQQIIVLGDVVGYGPHPQACIAELKSCNAKVIQGNHDYATATGDVTKGFSKLAKWAIAWSRENLTDSDKQWLSELEPVYQQDDWMAVHGAPMDKNYFYGYVYHMTYEANLDWMSEHQQFLAFHGHSHIPGVYRRNKSGDAHDANSEQDFSGDKHVLVCPGSVGQPRGGQIDAEYGVYCSAERRWQLHTVRYDVQKTIADMQKLQFPDMLYQRLSQGK